MPPTDVQKSFPWLASSRSWSKITFGADGTTTIVDTDGNVVTQNADGTWKVKDDQGGQADVGSKWPDNEFTKLIPKPNFEVSLSYAEGDQCGIQFADLTAEDLRAYAEQLKSAGYTVDAETTDEEQFGTWVYLNANKMPTLLLERFVQKSKKINLTNDNW